MGLFRFFDTPHIPNEIRVVRPQYVLLSAGGGWYQRVLHKGDDGSLWVHGFSDLEWLELDANGTVKETLPDLQQRRWREMPVMLDQPFAVIKEAGA